MHQKMIKSFFTAKKNRRLLAQIPFRHSYKKPSSRYFSTENQNEKKQDENANFEQDSTFKNIEEDLKKSEDNLRGFRNAFLSAIKNIYKKIYSIKNEAAQIKTNLDSAVEKAKASVAELEKNKIEPITKQIAANEKNIENNKKEIDSLKKDEENLTERLKKIKWLIVILFLLAFFGGLYVQSRISDLWEQIRKGKGEVDKSKDDFSQSKTQHNESVAKLKTEMSESLDKFKKDTKCELEKQTKQFENESKKIKEDVDKSLDKVKQETHAETIKQNEQFQKFQQIFEETNKVMQKIQERTPEPLVVNEEILRINEEIQRLQIKLNDSWSSKHHWSLFSYGYSHQTKMKALASLEKDIKTNVLNKEVNKNKISPETIKLLVDAYSPVTVRYPEKEDTDFWNRVLIRFLPDSEKTSDSSQTNLPIPVPVLR